MTTVDFLHHRLMNQCISVTHFKKPEEVVSWMGAVQGQDYLASLWAVGLRLPKATQEGIEKEIADRKIIRTWPMRGTLHLVAAADVHWMLKLLTPRIIAKSASVYRQRELTTQTFLKSEKLLTKALSGNKHLTRDGIYALLEKAKISVEGQRGLNIIAHLAQNGVLCFGTREGKQPTFVLLDEWSPAKQNIEKDEAIIRLARTYFKSHGPATLNDFAGWSGLSLTEVKSALDMLKEEFVAEMMEGQTYWLSQNAPPRSKNIHLLPAFDEFLIGYRDRSLILDTKNSASVILKNGIFNPIILKKGKVIGTWKRSLETDKATLELNPFTKLTTADKKDILRSSKRYAAFLKKEIFLAS
jgi:Winged helix DNA-binding domain